MGEAAGGSAVSAKARRSNPTLRCWHEAQHAAALSRCSPNQPAVVTTLEDAQAALRRLAGVLREAGIGHAGLHDLLLMYASVQVRSFQRGCLNVSTTCGLEA